MVCGIVDIVRYRSVGGVAQWLLSLSLAGRL